MSNNLNYLKEVLNTMIPSKKVGHVDGDPEMGDSLIKEKCKNKIENRVKGDQSIDSLIKPVDHAFYINKNLMLDEYGDRMTVGSLSNSEILEFDLEFLQDQSNIDLNLEVTNVDTIYQDITDWDLSSDLGSCHTLKFGDQHMATQPSTSKKFNINSEINCQSYLNQNHKSISNIDKSGKSLAVKAPIELLNGSEYWFPFPCKPVTPTKRVDIDLDDGLWDSYYSNAPFYMGDKRLKSAKVDTFSESHQLSTTRATGDVTGYATRQHSQPRNTGLNRNTVDRTLNASSDPSPVFFISSSKTYRGSTGDDKIIIAKGLCEDSYNSYFHLNKLSDRPFHECQLCDKRLQSTPSRWLVLRFDNKRKLVYIDSNQICTVCVEYNGHDTN